MTKAEKRAVKYAVKRGEDPEEINMENVFVKDNRFKKSVKGYAEEEVKKWSKFAHFSEIDLETNTNDQYRPSMQQIK